MAVSVPPLPSLTAYSSVSVPTKSSPGVYTKVPSANISTVPPLAVATVTPIVPSTGAPSIELTVSESPLRSVSLSSALPLVDVFIGVVAISSLASGSSFNPGSGSGKTSRVTVASSVSPDGSVML